MSPTYGMLSLTLAPPQHQRPLPNLKAGGEIGRLPASLPMCLRVTSCSFFIGRLHLFIARYPSSVASWLTTSSWSKFPVLFHLLWHYIILELSGRKSSTRKTSEATEAKGYICITFQHGNPRSHNWAPQQWVCSSTGRISRPSGVGTAGDRDDC